jgi:ABC-type multidrug transport system fused ATPase/permease subunit
MSVVKDDSKKVKLSRDTLVRSVRIFKYIKPYMGYFVAGMFLLVLGSLLFMVFPGLAGEMANIAEGKGKYNLGIELKDFWIIFLVILLGQGVFSYMRTIFFTIVAENGMADLRKELYNKIIAQNISFFEERRVGELTSRITTDVEQLQNIFSITLAELLRQIVILIVGIGIIAYLAPKLSLVMLATFPAIVILAMFFGKYIRKLSKNRQDKLAETNIVVEETFQSFNIVKSFANEWYESIRYAKSVDKVVKISIEFAKVRGLFFVFIITFLFGGLFFILWRGAMMVQAGEMEIGDLISFIFYTGILGGAIASFGSLYTTIMQGIGATERIMEILDADQEVKDVKALPIPLKLKGNVKFDNVNFSYPSRKDITVLKQVNINIKAGSKVALVGQSGSGKSTLVQLLMRFYDLTSGAITVDGVDIQSYNINNYRAAIGVVPQDVILFGGTIRENILYGKPDASEDEIIKAAEQSNSLEFINGFPEKFETIVGDRGVKLSGGQKQRIAIARALLKDPAILLLDEATSSLDAESERVVQEALDRLMVGRTSIIIAHRLATIKDVDCIYVIEKGKIVESGTHEDLSNYKDGVYSSLAKLQFYQN